MTLALAAKCVARSKPAFEAVTGVAEEVKDYHAFAYLVSGTDVEPEWIARKGFDSDVIIQAPQDTTPNANCSAISGNAWFSAIAENCHACAVVAERN